MKSKLILIVTLIIILLFLFLSLFNYYKKKTRNAVEIFAKNGNMINILIAGSNVFNNNKHDFYALLSYNPENNKIGITFIPPKFKVNLDGRGKIYNRIEEVDISDFKSLSSSLQNDLRLNIPFYVVLYSPDVERIVDLVEGIDLYVLDEINIPGIHFGINYFDGNKINHYINSVEENSIYKKYDRIQDILLTLYYNKEKYKKYFNLKFISEVLKTIKTNLLAQEVLSLSKLLFRNESDLICTIIPGSFSDDGFYVMDDMRYKSYRTDFLRKLIINNDIEQQVKIKILNGTDIPGLARKIRHRFVSEGFNVMEFGTSPYPLFEKTVIINRKGEIGPVKRVSEFLNINSIYHCIDSTQLNNVLLIVGLDLARQ